LKFSRDRDDVDCSRVLAISSGGNFQQYSFVRLVQEVTVETFVSSDVDAVYCQNIFADFDVHAWLRQWIEYLTRVIASKNPFNAIASAVDFDISAEQIAAGIHRILGPARALLAAAIAVPFCALDYRYLVSDHYEKLSDDQALHTIDYLMWGIWCAEWLLNAMIWVALAGFLAMSYRAIRTRRFRAPIATVVQDKLYRPFLQMSSQGASIVLVRNVHAEDAADRTLFLASETQAQRRALSGLVHDAKGPLNNFQLTLTLLNAGLSRLEAGAAAIDVTARWRRHLDVLQSETGRLAARLAEIDTLSHAVESEWTFVDIAAVLRDVTRMLRHEATMNELAIEIDAPADPIAVRGDPRALQLALLGLTACIFDATPAGGVVRLRGKRHGGDDVHIGIDATTAELPADLQTAMFRIGCAVDARYTTASAGRAIIEAHGGNIGVHADNGARRGFDIELPGG
jgi:signal transduction histidine kinase